MGHAKNQRDWFEDRREKVLTERWLAENQICDHS